jgi:site-specific recombinase XerD
MTDIQLNTLSRDVRNFLEFKRALGYGYQRGELTLRSFERFAKAQARLHRRTAISLEDTLKAWLASGDGRSAFTVALYLGVLRQLCLYRRRRDPNAFVPEYAWAPKTESIYVPHIFTREEIGRLLHAARKPQSRKIPPIVVRTLMLILYCTGLRFGEGARLSITDVDTDRNAFRIRESKGRTRIVPFNAGLAREIEQYMAERERLVTADPAPALWLDRHGQPLTLRALSDAIRKILRKEGLKPARGRRGARPYDFRHAFAVHRLTDWYRRGVDIHARLPWLSAYMGHVNVIGTEVYLHATPELLRLASQRFERRLNL